MRDRGGERDERNSASVGRGCYTKMSTEAREEVGKVWSETYMIVV